MAIFQGFFNTAIYGHNLFSYQSINQSIYLSIILSINQSIHQSIYPVSIHLIHFLLVDTAKLVSSSQTAGWVLRQNGLGRGTVDAPGLEFPNLVLETPAPTGLKEFGPSNVYELHASYGYQRLILGPKDPA